jgi:hypothetical protein
MICSDLNCLLANEIPPFFIVQSNIIAGLVFGGQVIMNRLACTLFSKLYGMIVKMLQHLTK